MVTGGGKIIHNCVVNKKKGDMMGTPNHSANQEKAIVDSLMENILDGEFKLVMMFKHRGVPYAQGTRDTIASALKDRKIHLDNRVQALADSFWRTIRLIEDGAT